jgi:predicted N-acetyltransferase YhbS
MDAYARAATVGFTWGYQDRLASFRRHLSYTEPGLARAAFDGDTLAAGVLIVDRQLRIGAATLHLGGIGDVFTLPQYRKKGYASAVFKDVITYLEDEAYDVSILFGIPQFYWRFGYTTALRPHRLKMSNRTAGLDMGPYRVRAFKKADLPAVKTLHARTARRMTLAVERSDSLWAYILKERKPTVRVAVDERDRVVGYMFDAMRRHDCDRPTIEEFGAEDDPAIARAFAVDAARTAKRLLRSGWETVVPPDLALWQVCAEVGGEASANWHTCGGGMARLVNVVSTFRKLLPEWQARVDTSPARTWQGSVTLACDDARVTLTGRGGRLGIADKPGRGAVVDLSLQTWTRLVLGFEGFSEVCREQGCEMKADLFAMLCSVFPRTHPYVWGCDGF